MLKHLAIALLLCGPAFGQVTKPVQVFSTSGLLSWPTNFLYTNIVAGSNMFIQQTSTGLVLNASGGSVSGSTSGVSVAELLVVSNQVQAASNALRTDVGTLQSATNSLHTRVGNLEGATNGLDSRLTTASNVLRTDITNLQGATNGLNSRAGNLEGATNGLDSRLTTASNALDAKIVATSNAIPVRLTNLVDVGRGFGGLTDGQVLKYHGASATWTNGTDNTGGGGGGLTTNANQFGASVELAIKDGVQLTNPVVAGSLSISNEPTGTVPTNTLYMGTDNYAGRIVPEWKDHNQLLTAFQPAFYNNRITCFLPSSGTTIGVLGVNASTTGGTTVSHPNPNNFLPYMVQLATPATSNGTASAFSGVDLASSGPQNTVGANGYFYAAEWTVTNSIFAVAGGGAPRVFVGLTALASPNLTNLVVTTNATGQYIGLYASPRDSTEMWISARDSGNEFRTNTGMSCITSNLYQFYLFNAPTSRFAGWKIKNLTAGTSASGWFSNNVPTNFMKFGIAIKNSTNLVNSVRFTKQYLEAPLAP